MNKSPSQRASQRASQRSSRRRQEQSACSKCWEGWTKKYTHFSTKTVFGRAFTAEYGAFFNFILSNVLFWALGLKQWSYDNERDSAGAIETGSLGSGVFVITLTLFVIGTVLYIFKIVRNIVDIRASDKAKAQAAAAEAEAVAAEKALHKHHHDEAKPAGGVGETKTSA